MPTTSWRINVNEIDKTQTVGVSPDKTAALAIIAPKGNKNWVFLDKGSTQQILSSYGYPSITYPAIQDLIDLNKHCGTWVCAPYKSGTYGGVFLTTSGTLPFVGGPSTQTIASYSGIDCSYAYGTGTGSKTVFSGVITNYPYYNSQSIGLSVNGTPVVITISGTGNVETLSSASGTGTYTKSTGTLVFTFNSAPALNLPVTATYKINIASIVYATLFNYNQQADDLKVKVTTNTTISGAFDINVYQYDVPSTSYIELSDSPYTVGLKTTDKDGYGNNIYIGNIFNDEKALFVPTIQNSVVTTTTDDLTAVLVSGGNRGTTVSGSDLVPYYELLTDTNKYNVNLIVDTTSEASIAAEFSSLRAGNELKYTSFILPTTDISAATIIASPVTARNSVNNRGIFYACLTWGLRTDVYQGNNFNCSNMGLVASKYMDCMINDPSEQPAYFNENGLCGGQLDSGIIKLNQTATQTQLKKLDQYHFNPIVIDPQYGAWLVGFRTTQSIESVYSYVAQSIEADLIIKDIINNVLTPQQGKANDDYHQAVAKANTEVILSNYSRGLDAYYVKCDNENNDATAKNQQKFILSVAVRYVAYAATLTLNFVTTPFGVSVEESLN
jgi:hypothetical protein